MQLIQCTEPEHAASILAIFNEAILNSTALYDYRPRTMETMAAWFASKSKGNFPIIGIANDSDELMGFASYGTFRGFPAYKYTVEHSVYVDPRFRGRGVGKRLLQEIIAIAKRQDYHVLVGAIDAANSVSIRLHERLGFTPCGVVRQAGFKFNRWLDLALYQLILSTPVHRAMAKNWPTKSDSKMSKSVLTFSRADLRIRTVRRQLQRLRGQIHIAPSALGQAIDQLSRV